MVKWILIKEYYVFIVYAEEILYVFNLAYFTYFTTFLKDLGLYFIYITFTFKVNYT